MPQVICISWNIFSHLSLFQPLLPSFSLSDQHKWFQFFTNVSILKIMPYSILCLADSHLPNAIKTNYMQKKWTYYARFYIRDHFLFLVKYAFQFQFWDPCVNLCNFLSIAIFWHFLPFFAILCDKYWNQCLPIGVLSQAQYAHKPADFSQYHHNIFIIFYNFIIFSSLHICPLSFWHNLNSPIPLW